MSPLYKRIKGLLLLALAALLLLGALCMGELPLPLLAQSQPEALGNLSGAIRNEKGDPLPNILVTLEQRPASEWVYPEPGPTVTSDASGEYHFYSIFPGDYWLHFTDAQGIYAAAYYPDADFQTDATQVSVSGNNVTVDMVLHPGGSVNVATSSIDSSTPITYFAYLYRQDKVGRWYEYREAQQAIGAEAAHFEGLPTTGIYRACATDLDHDIRPSPGWYIDINRFVECYDNVLPNEFFGVAPNAQEIVVTAGAPVTIPIVLRDRAQLEGTVLDPDGKPVAGVYVTVPYIQDWEHTYSATTDEQGHFRFEYLDTGSYPIHFYPVYESNYLSFHYPEDIDDDDNPIYVPIGPTTHMSITQKLIPGANITGKVTFPNDAPVPHVQVRAFKRSQDNSSNDLFSEVTPDATGLYTITHLAQGTYTVGTSYYFQSAQAPINAYYGGSSPYDATPIELDAGETRGGIDFHLGLHAFNSSIAGQVTGGGKPVAGIEVGLFVCNWSDCLDKPVINSDYPFVTTRTDDQGHYQLDGLAIGSYQVTFRDPAGLYATQFYSNVVYPSVPTLVTLTGPDVVDNINAELTPGATIRGHVRTSHDIDSGGFTVSVIQYTEWYYYNYPDYLSFATTTAADGSFELRGLPESVYAMQAQRSDATGYVGGWYSGEAMDSQVQFTVAAGAILEKMDIYVLELGEPTCFMPYIDNAPLPSR
jgi:hypothetical protein